MDWKKYESEIFETFKQAYPNAKILFNQKILGRYSKTERQVDVLVDARIAGSKIRLVIDAKHYSSKIDVKDVESFISMVEDIDAAQGILITSQGYTEAAINRAYYGPTNIELDILNFDELKQFQGFLGITYSGWHGAIIPAPFGWVVDGTQREGSIANIYQRGKTYEDAAANGEFIYVNLLSYNDSVKNLDDVLKLHENETREYHVNAKFEYSDTIDREDKARTTMRKILRDETELEEYTGFVGFDEYCVFCVLFTPKELSVKNIRKLEYCLERMIPINVDLNSVAATKISERRHLIEKTESDEEKAQILISIAEIHRDMKQFDKATEEYQNSIKLFPTNYGAYLGLLEMGFNTSQRQTLVNDFYNLHPGNRQICDDLVRVCLENKAVNFLESFFDTILQRDKNDDEMLGNIYFSRGDLRYTAGNNNGAIKDFELAKSHFLKHSPSHPAIESAEKILTHLRNN